MANNLITPTAITRNSLMRLENILPMTANANTEYKDEFAQRGYKAGDTINIRKPVRYIGTKGPLLQVQSTVETSVPLTLQQYQCSFSFSSKDLTLAIDDFMDRYVQPAIDTLANQIELDGALNYKNVSNVAGSPGTPPTANTLLTAKAILDSTGAPPGRKTAILDPYTNISIVNDTKGLFNAQSTIGKMNNDGEFDTGWGFNAYQTGVVASHTAGVYSGTPIVNGAGQMGSTVITSGWGAGSILNQGDTFRMAGVFSVNPQTRQSTGQLQSFVVTATTTADGSGNMTIPVYPSLTASGQYQTVAASPANSAAITVTSGTSGQTSKQSLLYAKDAFTFVTVPMLVPNGVDMGDQVGSRKSGLSIRMIRDYDINSDQFPCRLDILGGWATTYGEMAVRVEY